MCGIVGFIGKNSGTNFIIEGLEKLNYRGYDSAGIAMFKKHKLVVLKKQGKICELKRELKQLNNPESFCAIGHTRWATHGEPSDLNAHPIEFGEVVVVHNGIIENYLEIKQFLKQNGYELKTQTDTETVAALINHNFNGKNYLEAILKSVSKITGSYALAIIFKNNFNTIYSTKKDSPLVIGFGECENYLASDIIAFANKTKDYVILHDGEICQLTKDEVCFYNFKGKKIEKNHSLIEWNIEKINKNKFESFMLKEIFEQPNVVKQCLKDRLKNNGVSFEVDKIDDEWFKKFKRIHFVACGTAMHAGMFGKHLMESFSKTVALVSIASEFRYSSPVLLADDLVIIISQSGETADSLAALRLAKKNKIATLAIVNVKTSTIAQEADAVIFTNAGPEIAVASTKAFTAQLAIVYLLVIKFAQVFKSNSLENIEKLCKNLKNVPTKMEQVLQNVRIQISNLAKKFFNKKNIFFIGRGLDYYLALESSLKLKEISYIHSEAYAAGELKHGTISLIEDGVLVIAIATQKKLLSKTINNVKEVKSRGAQVLIVCEKETEIEKNLTDLVIEIIKTNELVSPFCTIIHMQMFAYEMAKLNNCDVDMPRNLAKSVTVE